MYIECRKPTLEELANNKTIVLKIEFNGEDVPSLSIEPSKDSRTDIDDLKYTNDICNLESLIDGYTFEKEPYVVTKQKTFTFKKLSLMFPQTDLYGAMLEIFNDELYYIRYYENKHTVYKILTECNKKTFTGRCIHYYTCIKFDNEWGNRKYIKLVSKPLYTDNLSNFIEYSTINKMDYEIFQAYNIDTLNRNNNIDVLNIYSKRSLNNSECFFRGITDFLHLIGGDKINFLHDYCYSIYKAYSNRGFSKNIIESALGCKLLDFNIKSSASISSDFFHSIIESPCCTYKFTEHDNLVIDSPNTKNKWRWCGIKKTWVQ